jgi:hypothetical protein
MTFTLGGTAPATVRMVLTLGGTAPAPAPMRVPLGCPAEQAPTTLRLLHHQQIALPAVRPGDGLDDELILAAVLVPGGVGQGEAQGA